MVNDFMRRRFAEADKQREKRRTKQGLDVPVLDKEWAEWLADQGQTPEKIGAYRTSLLDLDDDLFCLEYAKMGRKPAAHFDFFEDVTKLLEEVKQRSMTLSESLSLMEEKINPWIQRLSDNTEDEDSHYTDEEFAQVTDAFFSYCSFLSDYIEKITELLN